MTSQPQENRLKSFVPAVCPHCQKQVYVIHAFSHPSLQGIVTDTEVAEAKEKVLERLKEIAFVNEGEKEQAEKWIVSPDTIFSLGEVESIITSIRVSQIQDK